MASGFWAALLSESDRRLDELASKTQPYSDASLVACNSELQILRKSRDEAGGEARATPPEDASVSLQALSTQLTQLCTNANLTDEGAPGSLLDPQLARLRGMVAAHHQEAALEEYLQTDVPSMRWGGLAAVGSLSSFAAFDGLLTTKATSNGHQELRLQLQGWAAKRLAEANRDATASMIHNQLLKAAVRDRNYLRSKPEWWRLAVLRDDLPRSIKLAAGVYHLASSREAAWTSLEKCMWHSMALSTRLDAASQASGQLDHWSPFSFESSKVDLEQAHMDMVERVVKQAAAGGPQAEAPANGSGPVSAAPNKNTTAKLQEELMAMLSTLTPVTYLQMVGQKLLYHATTQLPILATLPDTIQPSIIRALYTLPFARAVSMALEVVCEDPEGLDPTPFAPKAADDIVKKWRVLQSNAAAVGPGESRVDQAGPDAKGPTKPGIKTILHVIKGITKDIFDFESGLLHALDQVPEVLRTAAAYQVPASFLQEVTTGWSLRTQSLRALLHSDMETALLAHRSGLGTLLVTAMTRAVRGMLAGPAKHPPGHSDSSAMPAEDVNSDLWPKLEDVVEVPGTMMSLVPEEDHYNNQQPKYIDPTSHQVLNFLAGTIHRMANFPDLLQALLTVAVLECFSLLLDHLASSCAPAHGIGQGLKQALPFTPHHAPRMLLLHHGASACARRLLLAFHAPLHLPLFDDYYEAMVKGYANTLLQAEELVSALSQQIVRVHSSAANALVLPAIDAVKWSGVRRPLKRPRAASAAPRTWRCCLARLLHGLVQLSTPAFTSWVIGQVLQEGLAAAALRYSELSPSPQLLPHYVADILHLTCTAHMFTLQRALPTTDDLLASSKGPSRAVSRALSIQRQASSDAAATAAAALQGRPQMQVAEAVAQIASDTCLALCTRAALLVCSPSELEQALQAGTSETAVPPGSRALRPQLPSVAASPRTSPAAAASTAVPGKAKLPALAGRGSAGGNVPEPLPRTLPPLPASSPRTEEAGAPATNSAPDEPLAAARAGAQEHQSVTAVPSIAGASAPAAAGSPPQGTAPAMLAGAAVPRQGQGPVAESTEADPGAQGQQGLRQGAGQQRQQQQDSVDASSSRPTDTQQQQQWPQRRQVAASSSTSVSLNSNLPLSGGASGLSGGASGTAAGTDASSGAPWWWLPEEVRSALKSEADGLVTEAELVHGFSPVNHMDVSTEEPFTLLLTVDKAEAAAAAKAMAAVGRERTLKRNEKSMGPGGAAKAGAEDGRPSFSPSAQVPSSRAPSTARMPSRAASSHAASTGAGSSAAAAAAVVEESLVAAAWAELMCNLAARAPGAAVLGALALRHELQPQVPGLPYSEFEIEERAQVQKLAEGRV